jgi:hypothetical protein
MSVQVTITWTSDQPDTIWKVLARKLGREPTRQEAADEVRRILSEASEKPASPRRRRRI